MAIESWSLTTFWLPDLYSSHLASSNIFDIKDVKFLCTKQHAHFWKYTARERNCIWQKIILFKKNIRNWLEPQQVCNVNAYLNKRSIVSVGTIEMVNIHNEFAASYIFDGEKLGKKSINMEKLKLWFIIWSFQIIDTRD